MPARAIEDEHKLFAWTGADLPRERRQLYLEQGNGDGGRQMEDGATRGWVDKADDIAPLVAVLHWRHWSLPYRSPNPPQNRFEADAVFVGGPQLDLRVRKGRRQASQEWTKLFLKAAWVAGSACVWCGRGTCGLCRRRCR